MQSTYNLERASTNPMSIIRTVLVTGVFVILMWATPLARAQQWIATWGAAPTAAPPLDTGFTPAFVDGFNNQTIRNIVHTSVGGRAVRVRLTNRFSSHTVTFESVYVGLVHSGAILEAHSNRVLTFRGHTTVSLSAGEDALSDPVLFDVPPDADLAISLFTEAATGVPTIHLVANETTYVGDGNLAASEDGALLAPAATSWYFVDRVDVLASDRIKGVVVAFGDSITDGDQSTLDQNRRWPNYLAHRILAGPPGLQMAVLDEGISANRLLTDSPCFGLSGENRLEKDVLNQPGVRFVILMEGLNDIGFPVYKAPFYCIDPNIEVSAGQIITGYEQVIAKVHAKGLKIFAGTLIPFKGAWYWTPEGEAKRAEINNFIKTSGEFDGVIDFAAAVADPNDPTMVAAQLLSRDNVHPNDAGYKAMADAVDLSLFLPPR